MHKLFFWLNWHNGDLVLCRPLVRRILSQHDVQITWGCLRGQAYIVEDLPVRVIVDPREDPAPHAHRPNLLQLCPPDHVPIYLWVAAFPDTRFHLWEYVVEIYNRQVKAHGLPQLQVSNRWVPMLDFPHLDVTVSDNAIFVENSPAHSGHSNFTFDMAVLAKTFPDLVFYCTANPACEAPNIINCSSLNLLQLSAISNKCDAIVGRGSGPFCSTLTEPNRYKPRAIMQFHPLTSGPTIWDYPGNPMAYLETHDELVRFFHYVKGRKKLCLSPGSPPSYRNPSAPALPPETAAAELDYLIQKFQRHPSDPDLLAQIRPTRDRLLQLWLNLPADQLEWAYRGAWGKTHRRLMTIDVRNLCRQLPESNSSAAPLPSPVDVSGQVQDGAYTIDAVRGLLVAMLCSAPHELPACPNLHLVPAWMRSDFSNYLLPGRQSAAPAFLSQNLP